MLHVFMVISSILVAITGIVSFCILIFWIYGKGLNYIGKVLRVNREFSSFLKQKYWKPRIKPTINKTNFKEK